MSDLTLFDVEPDFERFDVQPACFVCGARGSVVETSEYLTPRAVVMFARLAIDKHMAFAHPELVEASA